MKERTHYTKMTDDHDDDQHESSHKLQNHVKKVSNKYLYQNDEKNTSFEIKQPTANDFLTFKKFCEIMLDAIPATLGLLFVFVAETINILFIGKYNDSFLISGIGLGTLYINATGYILGAGLIGGIDTLCTHAYGAKRFKMLGNYANIARVIIISFFLIMCIPAVVYCFTFLRLIGQDEKVSEIAQNYCYSMLPSLFFALQYNISLRYLQAMKIFTPGFVITLTTALFHPMWCYIFIFSLHHGVIGAGMAMSTTQLLNLILISLYIHFKNPCPKSYFFINRESFNFTLIWDYLKKAVPAAILFAADWLGFEVLTLMSSYISADALAANICLFNFITLIFMIPCGLSFAATTLVGNAMGEKNPTLAKSYTYASIICGLSMISITTLLVIIFKKEIPLLYTKNPIIAELFEGLLGIYVCFSLIDSVSVVLHGVIKGLGLQRIASTICIIVLYPLNIPLAWALAFKLGLGLKGLWYSQFISIIILTFSYITICSFVDWNEITYKIYLHFKKRQQEDKEKKEVMMGDESTDSKSEKLV